ncbi:hypothetical protein [uncultured Arcobacter sp.]|uniref:hypothetical protein n=1 Tax=uncultured Arcobacter sp. TaxID=165434 RepID=UPI00261A34B4|nr:hypothetical protein [uncultured Arcobacter sp.]
MDGMKLENAKVVFDECKIDIDDVITEHDSKLCIFNSYVNCKGIIPYNSVLQVENDSINTNGGNALHCDNNSIIKAENSIFECGKEDNDACGIYYGDAKFIYITGCHFNGYDMGMIFPARTKNIQSKIDSIKKSEIELREDENGQKTCYYFD